MPKKLSELISEDIQVDDFPKIPERGEGTEYRFAEQLDSSKQSRPRKKTGPSKKRETAPSSRVQKKGKDEVTTAEEETDVGTPEKSKPARPKSEPPRVLSASFDDAKRVTLYLHPADFRALGVAKLDDGADVNSRIRAMIALYRADDKVRSRVDRLARSAPRGRM